MFGRILKTKLPTYRTSEHDEHVKNRDFFAKSNEKRNADVNRKSKPSQINFVDTVLFRQKYDINVDTQFNTTS